MQFSYSLFQNRILSHPELSYVTSIAVGIPVLVHYHESKHGYAMLCIPHSQSDLSYWHYYTSNYPMAHSTPELAAAHFVAVHQQWQSQRLP